MVFVTAFAILFGNLTLVLGRLSQPYLVLGAAVGAQAPLVLTRRQLDRLGAGAVLVASTLMAFAASSRWLLWLRFRHGAPFGDTDPILGRDVAFYVFELPLLEAARAWLMALLVLSLALSVAIYWLAGLIALEPQRGIVISRPVRQHLSWLVAGFFLLLAFGAYLDIPRLLLAPGTNFYGPSYVDVAARVPVLTALMWASVIGAALAVAHAVTSGSWPLLAAAALYLVVWLAARPTPPCSKNSSWNPTNRRARRRTSFTTSPRPARRSRSTAWRSASCRAMRRSRREDIARTPTRSTTCRLWDHQPLLDTFGQIQEIRTYYDFVSVDNDRYQIGGEYRQIMLSARELNSESLPNRTWINERLVFTHGYGVALGPVNQVTQEGLPVLFIKNLPPESTHRSEAGRAEHLFRRAIERPRVRADARARVPLPEGRRQRLHRPTRDRAACRSASVLRKLLFSLRFRSWKMLLSDDIRPESRVLFHRQHRRARRHDRAVPDLRQRSVPGDRRRPALLDLGRLHDQPAVSVLGARGDGHQLHPQLGEGRDRRLHGTTTYYLADARDPIAVALGEVFPGLFRAARDDARDAAPAPSISRGHLRAADGDVRDLPHDQSRGLLQQGGSVGGAGDRRRAADALPMQPVLHDDAAARRGRRGVHPDAAVHAAAEGQSRGLDGGAQRRRALREDARVPAFRSRKSSSVRGRSWRASTRIRRSRRRSRCGTSRGRR